MAYNTAAYGAQFYGGAPYLYGGQYSPQGTYQPYAPMQNQNAGQLQTTPQMMTPPTIHAEIVQVDNEQAAAAYPVGPGASQMMIAKDDSFIAVKTATPNGQYTLDVYIKRPQAPPEPVFNPGEYVRRDELPELIAQALAGRAQTQKRVRNEEAAG